MSRVHSFSSLELYRQCPRKYKFKYIERRALPAVLSAELEMGRIVHEVIEKLYRAAQDGVVISRADTIDQYDRGWSAVDTSKIQPAGEFATVDDTIRAGARLVGGFWDRYQPFDEGTLLAAEQTYQFGIPGTDIRFRGKVDRLWKRDDGTAEICDYKTGRRLARVNDHHFVFQMGLYQLAVKEAYPHLKTIEVAQYFLRMDEIVRCRFSDEQLDEIREALRLAVVEIETSQRLDDFPAHEDTHCSWCEYQDICPAKIHRKRLEEEPDLPIGDTAESARKLAGEVDAYIDLDMKFKELKKQRDALKERVTQISRETGMEKLCGTLGDLKIRVSNVEKFVTKSTDAAAFAELNSQARSLGLGDYMQVDSTALLKAYQKVQLSPEAIETLKPFIVNTETVRVTPRRRDNDPGGDDEE